jgi:hypothetical protein
MNDHFYSFEFAAHRYRVRRCDPLWPFADILARILADYLDELADEENS